MSELTIPIDSLENSTPDNTFGQEPLDKVCWQCLTDPEEAKEFICQELCARGLSDSAANVQYLTLSPAAKQQLLKEYLLRWGLLANSFKQSAQLQH